METLIFERQGPVGWLRLNRPDRLNAQVPQMWRELAELGGELQKDSELRALVVTGVGRSFSSGIDVSQFSADPLFQQPGSGTAQPNGRDPFLDAIARFQEGFLILAELAVPTIAAVRGHALGAGFQLALACDLRIVARGTKLGMLEHRYGLVPDLGGTVWLPRLVGPAKAKELIWTAATFDAEEADRLGLVNRL
ncbi:MAG: enoyl-CoA hydratase/isomerase family protein, partial [Acidimicrobiia bacterium]